MFTSLEKLKSQLREKLDQPNEEVIDKSSSSVMVLFHNQKNTPEVLMIKRSENLRNHSGEWAFPGGKFELSDDNLMETAFREVTEEIGINKSNIRYWLRMKPVNTFTGFTIWPFIGMINEFTKESLQINKDEVSDVMSIPVDVFLDDKYKREITFYENNNFRKSDAFTYKGKIIWGASAKIITNIFNPILQGEKK
ncbi:MAG: coenzyme A pyrophosphatase [Chloroflexi bacterium]|nr:coenzyme A pyrophosphatase [Chloroflexota bacterium]|tara:strand:+ start:1153 stop:1737 length:585 start_codon:yes stop_codon:yes gene_type:complete